MTEADIMMFEVLNNASIIYDPRDKDSQSNIDEIIENKGLVALVSSETVTSDFGTIYYRLLHPGNEDTKENRYISPLGEITIEKGSLTYIDVHELVQYLFQIAEHQRFNDRFQVIKHRDANTNYLLILDKSRGSDYLDLTRKV